jgi:hypothetical protein
MFTMDFKNFRENCKNWKKTVLVDMSCSSQSALKVTAKNSWNFKILNSRILLYPYIYEWNIRNIRLHPLQLYIWSGKLKCFRTLQIFRKLTHVLEPSIYNIFFNFSNVLKNNFFWNPANVLFFLKISKCFGTLQMLWNIIIVLIRLKYFSAQQILRNSEKCIESLRTFWILPNWFGVLDYIQIPLECYGFETFQTFAFIWMSIRIYFWLKNTFKKTRTFTVFLQLINVWTTNKPVWFF